MSVSVLSIAPSLIDQAIVGANALGKRAVASALSPDSLSEAVAATRINPRTLVEENLRGQSYLTDILHLACSTFSGYYLSAASMMAKIDGVSVISQLERLNPNRDLSSVVLREAGKVIKNIPAEISYEGAMNLEEFSTGLPFKKKKDLGHYTQESMVWSAERQRYVRASSLTFEAAVYDETGNPVQTGQEQPNAPGINNNRTKDAIVTINETSNLGVGKILEVVLGQGKDSVSIPVTVTLSVGVATSESFCHILSLWNRNYTLKERWHGLKSGELKFWRDIVFMQDIHDQNRKAILNDKTNYLLSMQKQQVKNAAAAAISGKPSIATASSIFILSSETMRRAELEGGFEINNPRDRQNVFAATMSMLLFVVDREEERVRIYHRGIDGHSEVLFRELKAISKGNGADVSEILKAYRLGQTPTSF